MPKPDIDALSLKLHAMLKEYFIASEQQNDQHNVDPDGDFSFVLLATVRPRDMDTYGPPMATATRLDREASVASVVTQIDPLVRIAPERGATFADLLKCGTHSLVATAAARVMVQSVLPAAHFELRRILTVRQGHLND